MTTPHQFITGALNCGEDVYAVGNTERATFIACAVGSNVVVLKDDLTRLQVISGCFNDTEHLVNSLSCCQMSGKIAAAHGNIVRIFEPRDVISAESEHVNILERRWVETQCFTVQELVDAVRWNMDGMRLTVVMGDRLLFYQQRCLSRMTALDTNPSALHNAENEQARGDVSWDVVWSVQLALTPRHLRYSPDGAFLTVAGEYDHSVKIFYQELERDSQDQLSLDYVTLHHPSAVLGFEWRRVSRYMTRSCVQAVLMTLCEDKVIRIWKETPSSEYFPPDLGNVTGQPCRSKCWSRKVRCSRNRSNKKLETDESQFQLYPRSSVQFHLAATIDVESVNGVALREPLHLHWMNNKELVFDNEVENLMSEVLSADNSSADLCSSGSSTARQCSSSSADLHFEEVQLKDSNASSVRSDPPSSRNTFDVKLEIMLGRWVQSTDILFAVHPVDGSLLTWTVEWLDDPNRQAFVSFNSRLPAAFPVIDASSIRLSVHTFIPRKYTCDVSRRKEDCEEDGSTSNVISLLTNHENGSLNLWHMTMDRNNLAEVHYVTHISRMCGHHFFVTQVIAHPFLPLLLTVSRSRRSQVNDTDEKSLSEIILWRSSSVSPLCKSGGLKELARIVSPNFGCVRTAWIPSLWPRCCFVVCDGRNLVIYQANVRVHDFAGMDNSTKQNKSPAESLPAAKTSQGFFTANLQQFHASLVEVGRISGAISITLELFLLHVFPKHLVDADHSFHEKDQLHRGSITENCKTAASEQYFVVLVERGAENDTFTVHSLDLTSHSQPAVQFGDKFYDDASLQGSEFFIAELKLKSEKVCQQRVPLPFGVHFTAAIPTAGHLPSSTFYPFCQAPFILCTSSDDDVLRFWRCRRAEASAEVKYEWEEWAVMNSQSTELKLAGKILSVSAAYCGRIACAYSKTENLEDAHTIADMEIGVFECESSGGLEWMKEDILTLEDVHIPDVSTTVPLSSPLVDSAADFSTSQQVLGGRRRPGQYTEDRCDQSTVKGIILLDWVSTEHGSHILTVGTAAAICMYTQVLCDLERQTSAARETDISMSSPTPREPSRRLIRWVCTRVVELQSASGLPSVLTSMGWTRDGLLIVGIQSEMRVYNQWNLQPPDNVQLFHRDATNSPTLKAPRSHSASNQLQKSEAALSKTQLSSFTTRNKKIACPKMLDGLFEAARLAAPVLPQYHPKQLIALLNAGKRKRVEAILLHVLEVLKQHEVVTRQFASSKGIPGSDDTCDEVASESKVEGHCILDSFPMLPLHVLYSADSGINEHAGKERGFGEDDSKKYDALFSADKSDSATSIDVLQNEHLPTAFTAQNNRLLAELLTHTHLPGLSDTEQIHLLAIANTLSQFSSDLMNFSIEDTAGDVHKCAAAPSGVAAVDECGQRYLMALKRREYLLVHLPEKEKMVLKDAGLASSDIIWALHSETEAELLDAISCLQKTNPTWDELRSLGVGWWLKSTASLKILAEKLAKAAFQQNQDPMDSSLYYLALKKKTFLSHLFKTVRNSQMADFFMQDFNTEHWKKVAAKNAFVLMSKQRFHHAAAFFLLSGSLKDAVQTILCKCHDIQLAMVMLRLCESNFDAQHLLLKEILCREVLGQTPEQFDHMRGERYENAIIVFDANKDPFLRSMAYWLLKDYSRAVQTLVQAACRDQISCSPSDVFSLYSYLRKHPLVMRHRHTNAGTQISLDAAFEDVCFTSLQLVRFNDCRFVQSVQAVSYEHFVEVQQQACTALDRRLYFRTAVEHMVLGCPMLALNVLSQISKRISNTENHGTVDGIAQHLKYKALLRVLTEELLGVVNSFGGDAVQLRLQLRMWLKKEVEVLKDFCNYRSVPNISDSSYKGDMNADILELKPATERHDWLHQHLFRSMISFCVLHSAQNIRLTPALFEFLLLLAEAQTNNDLVELSETAFDSTSLPPLFASIVPAGIFFDTPSNIIESRCHDLLSTILDLTSVTEVDKHLQKAYMLYNHSVSLSSCLYQSLCNFSQCFVDRSDMRNLCASAKGYGSAVADDFRIMAPPSRWPDVNNFLAY